jgi:hypothetical protein
MYETLILSAAQGQGVEPALVKAVIKCESGFNPSAQSPKGAQGLMQLMPGTQTMLGVSNPFDPQHNIIGGTRYLAMLKQMFGGDLRLTLAAYNAGPQTVIAANYTVPTIVETQQYVQCVLAAYERYRQPGLAPIPMSLSPRPPGLVALAPGNRMPGPAAHGPQTLVVQPLRLSSQVARLGQRLTVELEAINTSARLGYGIVMLNYPEHLVSLMAMHTSGHETTVQLPLATAGPGAIGTTTYRLLSSHWQTWAPGERRTASITMVPRLPQELTLHVSVVLDEPTSRGASQRWSSVLRIPFQSAALMDAQPRRRVTPRR